MKHPTNPGGWWAGYFPTIMSGAVLRMRADSNAREDGANASRDGVGGVLTEMDAQHWSLSDLDVLNACERVHRALRESDRGDRLAIIRAALGAEWTVDNPAVFSGWPSDPTRSCIRCRALPAAAPSEFCIDCLDSSERDEEVG
jgi:hypothetical protein